MLLLCCRNLCHYWLKPTCWLLYFINNPEISTNWVHIHGIAAQFLCSLTYTILPPGSLRLGPAVCLLVLMTAFTSPNLLVNQCSVCIYKSRIYPVPLIYVQNVQIHKCWFTNQPCCLRIFPVV